MDVDRALFTGKLIRLGSIDHENDPAAESRWTHDPYYMRMLDPEPVHPLSPEMVKKKYEALEKEIEQEKNLFHFTIRNRKDDRLLGFARLDARDWTNGNGWLKLGIGSAGDRRKGYGGEALNLLLSYAFSELNLYRLTAAVPEYNQTALHLAEKAGFVEEVRRRGALEREGRRWDMLLLGLLQEEWHG